MLQYTKILKLIQYNK